MGSDLLLFPSVAEGLGMVVVEAQAAGLPVLASDTTPEECVVVPALTCFLPLESGPEKWSAQAMQTIEAGHQWKQRTHELLRQSAFSIENSARQLKALYSATTDLHEVV